MREEGNQEYVVHPLAGQAAHGVGNGGMLIAHSQLDRHTDALLELGLHIAAGRYERRACGRPNLLVGFGGVLRPRGEDGEVNDAEPGQPVDVQDASVHEELAQVAAHVRRGRRIGGPQVDKQNAFAHVARSVPKPGRGAFHRVPVILE